MSNLFNEKAQDWDSNDLVTQLSRGIGNSILDQVTLNPAMRVMDFGAGTGLISSHVAPNVKNIIAVDISAAMLEKLAAKEDLQEKVETVCQNILEQPLEQQFDLIVSAMAMHHVEDTGHLFQTFSSHLKPGARVALADLDKEDGSFHPQDVEGVYHSGFDRSELQAIMENKGFSEIQFTTAVSVNKDEKEYPVFLVTAVKN